MNAIVEKLIKSLGEPDAHFARKAINYYDGKQPAELIKALSDPSNFRKNWREKGLQPRTRNITKAIIDKSGLLFNDKQPTLSVWKNGVIDNDATLAFLDLMDRGSWVEFFVNFDNQVRMLKTGLMLIQWDNESRRPLFDALHRGNCAAAYNPNTREITDLLVITSTDDGVDCFRHFNPETITDLERDADSQHVSITGQFTNPYGIVPVVAFHDTNLPRYGIWNTAPTDLIGLNEMYNLHLMDSEYSAAWSKVKTLFTNADFSSASNTTETFVDPATGIPRQVPSSVTVVGGPGRIVQVDSPPGATPYVEYKGPDVSLSPVDEMFSQWVKDFAADWSVRLQSAGNASASSGFQLVVEEMPNLELRKQRQKMFQAGLSRVYRIMALVTSGVPGVNLPPEGTVFAEFQPPSLPVDDKAQEEVWSRRIQEGRASRVDYFVETKGMTAEEAIKKVTEIDGFNLARPLFPTKNTTIKVV